VSIFDRISASANRHSLLLFTVVALAGLCSSVTAQTAPQLLPYSVKVIAGGGTAGGPGWTTGEACPISGYTSTDIYGDGCLAAEIALTSTRTAVSDAYGNVFFADYTNGLIRRVDASTGVITTVAGGVAYTASPSTGSTITTAPTVCSTGGSTVPTDVKGDGCLGTQVYLAGPLGLAISPAGDLYFSELGVSTAAVEKIFGADVRKIAASAVAYGSDGCTNPSGCQMILTTGTISMVDGALSSYYNGGYTANNYSASPACSDASLTNCINAATQSYLADPYGIAFDSSGNLYIAEEYKEAILAVNTNATGDTTVAGVTIPPGTVAQIAGYSSTGSPTCPNGYSGTYGCTRGTFTNLASANSSELAQPFGLALDSTSNIYFADDYNYNVGEISSTAASTSWATSPDVINNFAGKNGTEVTPHPVTTFPVTTRGVAGSFAIGNPHGVAIDSNNNAYITDAINGAIWRVDGTTNNMYVVAGGASTVCATSIVPGVTTIDAYGDGCAATSAKFGISTGSTGIFGVYVDANSNLFVADTLDPLVREVASGTQFGPIGANQPTDYVDIHFAAGDKEASSGAFALAATGADNFSLGSDSCTTNSDTTRDCVLAIQATPSVLGAFAGTLKVTANSGATANFPLSGTYVESPETRSVVSAAQAATCTNLTAYNTTTPVILTATLFSDGAITPTGTFTFYINGTQIGTAQPLANGTTATLTYTFSTAGNYAITATYTPTAGSYYITSTSLSDNITSATPSLSATAVTSQLNTVSAGQTALYSFNLQQGVYTGTITFACSGGLPANSSCVFNPTSFTASGCQVSNTVALSILTQQASPMMSASFGSTGRGLWPAISLLLGIGLALFVGIQRRRTSLRMGRLWMVLALLLTSLGVVSCNSVSQGIAATPSGTYSVTVTTTGSTGTTSSFTVPLTVN
jgi:hypothetical protein